MESVGFKEWSLVCEALGRGEQSVIIRKGGMAEGRGGFSFRHREFFLFPTFFHQQIAKVRTAAVESPSQKDRIPLSYYAEVERVVRIDALEMAEALAPFHVLTPEVVRERFAYKTRGLDAALVRVFRVQPVWELPQEKRFAGCRSWVELPPLPNLTLQPVLAAAAHGERSVHFEQIVAP